MKKLLSMILVLLLTVQLWCGLGIVPSAAAPAVQGTDVATKVMAGYTVTAVPDDAVALNSASDFSTMSSGGVYYLNADITVVSTYTAAFKGELYGNGHTVTVNGGKPIFGTLEGAEIYDLTVKGTVSQGAQNVGALAAEAYDTILVGITNEANVHNSQKGKFAGGIVGYVENTTLRYCVNKGAITGHSSETRLGGLVGQMDDPEATLTLENCINYGAITGANQTGGLVSRVENGAAVTFKNCANFGAISVSASDGGGIIGKIRSASTDMPHPVVVFEGCYNSARLTGATYTGGLVGPIEASKLTVTDCHNGCFVKGCACGGMEHGKLTNFTGGHVLGGLIGNFWINTAEVTITDCSNGGDLISGGSGQSPAGATGGSRTGGIAGVMECAKLTVKNCHNSGDISSAYYIGGLFARAGAAGTETLQAIVSLQSCSNSGKLESTASYGGGIIGFQEYAAMLTFTDCHNSGAITTKGNTAGILALITAGHVAGCVVDLTDCSNSGKITGGGTSGGLLGYLANVYELVREVNLTNCTNKGDVSSPNKVGGLVGDSNAKKLTATDCRNEGDIDVVGQNESACAGGIVGRTYGETHFTNCVNTGNVIRQAIKDKNNGASTYDLYAGGIAGWAGRSGADYKVDVAVFENCTNASTIVAQSALSKTQAISAGGIVGVSRSTCYAKRCLTVGQVNGTRQVAGIAANNGSNGQGGSEFNACVVAAELYNNGAKVTDRTHGSAGIACYVWGDVHVYDCVVMNDITLEVSGSDLLMYERRPCSALVGYTNNGGGEFLNNFFGGMLNAGEGTDCIVVMLAYTVDANVEGDEGGDIDGNYSYYEYPLHYWGNRRETGELVGGEYSESKTPRLTEEQIAEGISFADILVGDDPNMKVVKTCTGIEVPMLGFMQMDYEWALDLTGGHGYVENCDPTCIKCGKAKVELSHTYANDCDTTCDYCKEEREVEDHDYGPWITVKAATETETGLRKSVCNICGFEELVTTPVLTPTTPDNEDESNSANTPGDGADAESEDNGMMIVIIGVGAGVVVLVVVIAVVVAVARKKKKKNTP